MIQPDELKEPVQLLWSAGHGTDVWDLFCACRAGDLAAVKRLVGQDPSLIRAHYEYRTPLGFAVLGNHVNIAAWLLDQGADPLMYGNLLEVSRERGYVEMAAVLEQATARLGGSPRGNAVAAAIRDRDLAEVRRLLDETPALLHEGDERSVRPIHWAVMSRQLDAIDELLARGADINARRADGAQAIHLTNGDYFYRGWRDVPKEVATTPEDVYRHIVARGAIVDMGMAAATGDIARVRELVAQDPAAVNRVSDYGSYYIGCGSPLKNAAARGHMEIVRLLLDHGADPNLAEEGIAPHGHALYSAVYNTHHDIAKLLLDRGAYPNPEVESSADAVSIAIMNGDTRMLELLAAHGGVWDIDMRPRTPLTNAQILATGIRRSVRILAADGDVAPAEERFAADPSLANDPAALSAAANAGHKAFVLLMLRHQPGLAKGVTVGKPRAMAELLFEHGMDANRPSWPYILPLHRIAEHGDVEIAALFLDHGADIDARDEEHQSTPLGWAARKGRTRMVEFLLERGARRELPGDPPWATPLSWATRKGHADIVRLLS